MPNVTERIQEDMYRNSRFQDALPYSPCCQRCSKPLVAGSTVYDPETVCQCPIDWKKLAKNTGRRAERFNKVIEEAHRKAAKSKLRFGEDK